MNSTRLRKLRALTQGAAILSLGVSACAKTEPIVNAPETQSSASSAPTTEAPATVPPRVVLNAPPQMPATADDAGTPGRMVFPDGGRRPPFLNAPPHAPRPPPGNTP